MRFASWRLDIGDKNVEGVIEMCAGCAGRRLNVECVKKRTKSKAGNLEKKGFYRD